MYSTITTTSKQVLVWALMFTLVLSVFPTTVADEADDEWFYDISENVTDEDGDGSDDTIDIVYDPDTDCDCDINITVYIDIYDEDGYYVEEIYDNYTINNGYYDEFSQDWTPDYNGIFDFYVYLYDGWGNFEDNWNVTDIELTPMTGSSDETINVDNQVGDYHEDGVNNDFGIFAFIKNDGVEGVEVEVEYFNGVIWTYYANGTTDDNGDFIVENATTGEYRWTAEYDGEGLEDETLSYTEVDTVSNLSHVVGVDDWDGAGDYDDFFAYVFEDDDTKDDAYIEIYDDDGDLYDSGNTDYDYYGYDIYLLDDVEKGNYTFDFYYEEDGELLQSGWLHSYGSTSTHYEEWFEDWNYETEDTNGDGVANSIITKYDPNTECNCTVDIEVDFSAYNNDTGAYDGGDSYYHEINSTEVDSFETDEWSPSKNGNYTFEFYLYDEDYNYEDHFNFTVYLECDEDSNDSDCDNDEWFEDWDYDTESTDDDNLVDTINVDYDPDTDCDCEVNVYVYMDVYENASGNLVDYTDGQYHEINGTEEEYFTQSWTSRNSTSYDFYVYMNDDNWNYEDEFWVYNVFLYAKSGAGGAGDDDEWFDWIDAYTYDDDDDGYDDTAELDYDPDTACECDINITLYIDIYDNETGYWVNGTEEDYTIYSDDDDYWYQEWSPEYNGTFDFYVELYDEDGNLEEEVEYLNISLHARSSGGGGDGDDDEWFYSWDHDVDPSDTITIGYDPDTECDCNVTIYVYVDVYDNETGDYLDYTYAEHEIYNEYYDEFSQDWTAYENGNYDFDVYMYDEDWNFEDEFWIYDVYLSSDDGGGGNGTGDDNGVGHVGIIDDWEEDGYVNDYIGGVLEDDEFKEDAYFEIYDEDGNLVDSGNPNYFDVLFVSYNLTEGWYYQDVYYEEDDALLQTGPFYSYGNSSNPETSDTVNVDNLVVDEDEYAVYDDVGFIAHRGNTSTGESGVEIAVYMWNEDEESWYDHAYLVTNETGEAWLYNETCGEYEWEVYNDGIDEKGYYEVWAGCDDTGGGGGSEDDDEWFYDWGYDIDPSDTITIGYDPDTECDCNVTINVFVDIYHNGSYVDSLYANHTIYNGYGDWFEQNWTADEDGVYDFNVSMYDEDWNLEDGFWITHVNLSYEYDEWIHAWIHYVPQDENGNNNWNEIVIGYDPQTECDCDVDVDVYLVVYDENGAEAASSGANHTINGEQEDWFLQELSMNIEPGVYDFYVDMYDEDGNHEEDKSFSLIMSDEWFDHEWAVEDGNVKIDLEGRTNYDGEIDTHYEVNVYRWNEDENDWEEIDSLSEDATISSGSPAPLHFEWEAEESGDYRFVVSMFDEMGQEDSFDFMEEINLNQAPVIKELNVDHLFEGQLFNFEVDAFDADDDELEYTWDMGDGSPEKEGDSVRYGYQDDGVYTIEVSVSDGEFTTVKEFEMIVENMAPALEVSFVDEADEGSELSFAAQVNDVASDEVTVTWTFADGSRVEGTFAQYTFRDNGEYLVVVVAEDEDGGTTMQQLLVIINNVAPAFTQFIMPSGAEEGEALDFMVSATDPGDDTITYTFDFGDDTAIMMTPDGNISHKFADGDTFTIVICAQDEDGGESCRTETLPVSILEQMEEEGLLPGFGVLGALSALGMIGILRRRTH